MATALKTGPVERSPRCRELEEDQVIVIPGVDFATYEKIDELLQDAPVRFKFLHNELQIMSPIGRDHELIKSNISTMIEAYCFEKKIFFDTRGMETLKVPDERGGEPDESYTFTRGQNLPDMVIESVITSAGINGLEFYRGWKIPEVWIWQRDHLEVHALEGDGYIEVKESRLLPGIDLELIEQLAPEPFTYDVVNRFRKAIQ
jgi:Uma2 family endonuclease